MTPRNEINHARALLTIALASLESGNTFECAKFLYAAGDAIDSVTQAVQQVNLQQQGQQKEGKGRKAA